MAHVNRQSVCSVEPALWADSWQRVSAGVVRRAACRSEIPSMFAVRMRLSHSRRELSSTCIEPSDERMGSVAGRTARSLRSPRAAIGESLNKPTTTRATPLPKHRPTGHAEQITAQQEPGPPGKDRPSQIGRVHDLIKIILISYLV